MKCLRCGAVQRFATPIIVAVYVAAGRAFERLHRGCEPQGLTPERPLETAEGAG